MLKTKLARRVHFSCGHKYEVKEWSQKENEDYFGSCYSPFGHGHNYILEAWFEGAIDAKTGMVINLMVADQMLKKVTGQLDHHFLNSDVAFFQTHNPTTENIATFCFENIKEQLKSEEVKLTQVRLYENENLWVDIFDEMAGS